MQIYYILLLEKLKLHIPLFILLTTLLFGCSSTQTLSEGELLLAKNSIRVESDEKVNIEDAESYIQQKPNKTILGFLKFHLFLFNLAPDSYVTKRNIACDNRVDRKNERKQRKNEKRLLKAQQSGNDSTAVKLKKYIDCHPSFWDNLRNTIGEAPVVYDSNKTKETEEQLSKYLQNKGYFHNRVESEVRFKPKFSKRRDRLNIPQRAPKKVFVKYKIYPGKPYIIKNVSYSIVDKNIIEPVKRSISDGDGVLLKPGQNYNVERIDDERTRFSKAMRNEGFFYFNKEYIVFQIDSSLDNNLLNIKEIIRNPLEKTVTSTGKDTIIEGVHHKYSISKVIVNANFDPKNQSIKMNEDLIVVDGIHFINKSFLSFFPDVIANQIFIRPGDLFNEDKDEYTYKRLSGLNNFKFIDISYKEDETTDKHNLVCYINLTPSIKQSFGLEAEGTNTGGQLGTSGIATYKNKNTFNRAELFQLKVKAGLEAQQTINGNTSSDNESSIESFTPFNTIEYGAESSLSFPKLLIFNKLFLQKLKNNSPKTPINLSWNYQKRPEYTRTSINSAFSINFQGGGKNKTNYKITPLQVSFIQIETSPGFQNYLNAIDNSFFTNTYKDHYIQSSKFSLIWTNKTLQNDRNYWYFKQEFETAGNFLQGVSFLSDALWDNVPETDGGGRDYYRMFDIRFAQFVRNSIDIRHFSKLSDRNRLVYRFYGGIGVPYGNLNVLPFDKSFFGGGSNDIRAWAARRLGPGGITYNQSQNIDQLGDVLLEANVEYRFKLTNIFESALFLDAGNVWLINNDEKRPHGNFDVERFYKEFAIGGGMGFRFDFDFLIFRVDVAMKLKDPGLLEGERWIFQPKDDYKTMMGKTYNRYAPTFNIGIGYPF